MNRTRLHRGKFGDGKLVDHDMKQSLVKQITSEEIKLALFNIDDNKSPGPDGYGSFFFKKEWEIIGCDIMMLWKNFSEKGEC